MDRVNNDNKDHAGLTHDLIVKINRTKHMKIPYKENNS
jgi:hypothetical protein